MFRCSLNRIAAVVVLSLVVLPGCGDVSVNGFPPDPDYAWYWWWPDSTEFVARGSFSTLEPVDDRVRVRLDASNGSVAVIGQPGSGSVLITAEVIVGSDSLVDAQAGLDDLNVLVTEGNGEITIRTDQPGSPDGRQYVVNYTVEVPADLETVITQTNGDITVEGMGGAVTVDAVNGNVRLGNTLGDLFVDLSNGRIEGTASLPSGGEIRLSGVNTDIDLSVPTSTSAALSALSSTGSVTGDNLALTDPVFTGQSLTGTLGGGAGLIRLETVNGNIGITGLDP